MGLLARSRRRSFEVEVRYQYLKDKTQIRKIGLLHDPTPYAILTKNIAAEIAKDFGLEVVATETYKPDDADLSVQIGRINGAGAGAIVKMGQGGSTVTAAKNIRSLALDKLMLLAQHRQRHGVPRRGESLGDRFLFAAPPRAVARGAHRSPARRRPSTRSSRPGPRSTAMPIRTRPRAPMTP